VWFGGAVHPSTVQVARGWCSPAEMPPYWPWRRIVRDLALDVPFAAGNAGGVDELDRQLLFAAVVEALDAASRREPLLWSSRTCSHEASRSHVPLPRQSELGFTGAWIAGGATVCNLGRWSWNRSAAGRGIGR